jgi:hypothetical protein
MNQVSTGMRSPSPSVRWWQARRRPVFRYSEADLAFRVGGAVDAGATGPNAWRKFASEAQMSPKLVLDAAAVVSAGVAEHAPTLAQRLIDEGADARALHRACEVVEEHARRALRLIEIEGKPVAKKKAQQ